MKWRFGMVLLAALVVGQTAGAQQRELCQRLAEPMTGINDSVSRMSGFMDRAEAGAQGAVTLMHGDAAKALSDYMQAAASLNAEMKRFLKAARPAALQLQICADG